MVAALFALPVAGCGSPGESDEASSPGPQTSKSSSGQPSSGQPSFAAADGRDVGACADGNCEVAVSEPVTFRFPGPAGPATLSVTEVGANRVEYTVKSGKSQSKGGVTGPGQGCVTVLRDNGGGNSCGDLGNATRPSPQPGAVVIQAVTGEDGTAILHIVTG
ncbi:hypothetical protein [Streptomyces sp. NPDC046862]|uniref:hypothetical protein n=1 Tax=Streptomyces sp. NPDC046862 TaxID=3154603 RepID=UPI0034556B80